MDAIRIRLAHSRGAGATRSPYSIAVAPSALIQVYIKPAHHVVLQYVLGLASRVPRLLQDEPQASIVLGPDGYTFEARTDFADRPVYDIDATSRPSGADAARIARLYKLWDEAATVI